MYMVCGYVVHGESRWAVLSYIVLPSLRLSVCLCVFYPFMLYGCLHSVSGLASESVVKIFCVCSFLWRHVVLSCLGGCVLIKLLVLGVVLSSSDFLSPVVGVVVPTMVCWGIGICTPCDCLVLEISG